MKRIMLRCDDTFFYRMKANKQYLEEKKGKLVSWEDYIKILFGFSRQSKTREVK